MADLPQFKLMRSHWTFLSVRPYVALRGSGHYKPCLCYASNRKPGCLNSQYFKRSLAFFFKHTYAIAFQVDDKQLLSRFPKPFSQTETNVPSAQVSSHCVLQCTFREIEVHGGAIFWLATTISCNLNRHTKYRFSV